MNTKEVIIVGSGIAGCSLALALAKRGVSVTIVTHSAMEKQETDTFTISQEIIESALQNFQLKCDEKCCARAYEQIQSCAKHSLDELFGEDFFTEKKSVTCIQSYLKDQLAKFSQVEWLYKHSLIEILTLEKNSLKPSDLYKKPTCFGIRVYNHESDCLEYLLAKEVILATGGAETLYRYQCEQFTNGESLAIAEEAGVRLIHMDLVEFYPLALHKKGRLPYLLPLELVLDGAKFYAQDFSDISIPFSSPHQMSQEIYEVLLKNEEEFIWLDLTHLNFTELNLKYPELENDCSKKGFNLLKDFLPVRPTALYTCGGIAVDRTAQTNLQRLRAIGNVACTGVFYNGKSRILSLLESFTWAVSAAEDISKLVQKLVYYFPVIKDRNESIVKKTHATYQEVCLLKNLMWNYVGIQRDLVHLKRAYSLLQELSKQIQDDHFRELSISNIRILLTIKIALTITKAALDKENLHPTVRRKSPSLKFSSRTSEIEPELHLERAKYSKISHLYLKNMIHLMKNESHFTHDHF